MRWPMRRPALCCAVAFALLDGASGGGRRALQQAGACGPQLAATQLRHTAATPSRQVFTDSADECCGLAAARGEWQACAAGECQGDGRGLQCWRHAKVAAAASLRKEQQAVLARVTEASEQPEEPRLQQMA